MPKDGAELPHGRSNGVDRQRIDKWLWHARVVRTRSAAAELADRGHVRVNGARIAAASRKVGPGDVITVALDRVRVLKVLDFSDRRGAADAAKVLYEDLSPPVAVPLQPAPERLQGSGRPTKRDRRAIDKLRHQHDM